MKKGKGVVVANHDEAHADEDYEVEDNQADFPPATAKFSTRNASSKYDFVKVKVWLGDNADHYYVLSRFLLSRMLTVTKLMERRGYGEEYINRYKMMTRFHHQRVPLVILVCGTACVGKSTIATQLAQRLNLPNVLQTDMVYELLRTATDAPLTSSPVWARDFSSSEELITEFCRECRIVRKGLAGDLKKAMKDGKPIIIEGIHLDPSIYLMDDENKLPTDMQAKVEDPKSVASDEKSATQRESASIACGDQSENTGFSPQNCRSLEGDMLHKVSVGLESVDIAASVSDDKGETIKDLVTDRKLPVQKEKSGSEPIIIPIVLKMAEFDHKALLEEWISTRTFSKKWLNQDKDKLINNLKTIQDYLCSFNSQGLTVVNISATTFPQTLDWLHSYLLQCIEQGISSASNESAKRPAEFPDVDSSSEVTCLEQMRK